MAERERTVLHVLPHAGGGGDTYVDVLDEMPGYAFRRAYVAPRRKPRAGQVARGLLDLRRLVRGYDLLHVHGEATAGLFLPLLAVRRSVVTLHGLHLLRRVSGPRRTVAAFNLRGILRAASRTICVSNTEREQLAAVVSEKAMRRTVVVHNGARPADESIGADRARVRRGLGLDQGEPVGIWVGSLDERRDPLAVVRAAERTSTTVLFVGEGPLRADVERAASARARVLGQREDVPQLLAAADFFVLMSQREGFSFALLEAMAQGLPAIVAAVAENVEAVGDSGIAVPYGDEEAIAVAIRRLVDNAEERRDLGAHARERTANLFSADAMIARTRAVYDDVLACV
jgi:glycosyltransferase involved in cell wall biosynthesis